uniref:Uncharacterized protein n=1 Tax=Aureoumbra lagunensis TaxID=44058 RepID=A0A7S3ND69_9STRA
MSLERSGQENDRDDVSLGSLPNDRANDGFMSAVLDTQRTVFANALIGEAAPGTILARLTSSNWDFLHVKGSETAVISTATSIFTTLDSGSQVWQLAVQDIVLTSGTAVSILGPSTLSLSNISGGGTLFCSSDVNIQPLKTAEIRIFDYASLKLGSGAKIKNTPKLYVAQEGHLDFEFDATDSVVSLTDLSLESNGTIRGTYIYLDVLGDIDIAWSSSISATGQGGMGAAPGFDNAIGVGAGGSSSLGGSGGGFGGAGLAGLGAWYIEILADVAQNDVNTTPGLLSESSAQYLIEHFWPGTQNATAAAEALLALAPHVWNSALTSLRDHAAAAIKSTSGLATGAAMFAETFGGGRLVPESLSSLLTASGGNTYGDAYEPTELGSGGGARHVLSGKGGAGGGAIRLRVRGRINISGSISADGADGNVGGGGGGSGGSIWLENCSELVGNGILSADGGRGGGELPADRDDRETDSYEWIQAAAYGGGGGGGGGRIALSSNCSVRDWYGTVHARAGAPDGSTLSIDARYLGTIAWGNVSLAKNATISTAAADGTLAIGDYVEIDSCVSRRAPVQIIRSVGTGNGSITSMDEHTTIIRGSWRVRYRYSSWSKELSTVATASQVQEALHSLGTVGDISVDRSLNYTDGGWSWSITFFDETSSITQPLLVVDTTRVYSTTGNATLLVDFNLDNGVNHVEAPLTYNSAQIPVIGLDQLGAGRIGEWRSPSTLRLTVTNATGGAPASYVQAGNLNFRFNLSLSNASGTWVPTPFDIAATWKLLN